MSYGATADESPAASTAGYPTVVIIGRPNVGKSTFFNRLVGHRRALVEDLPGTTRDRLYGQVRWQGRTFAIADTGGWQPEERPTPRDRRSRGDLSEELTTLVRRQVETALDEADVILFMVDAKEGMTAADREIGQLLREAGRPLLILANKADNEARLQAAQEFYELALGEPIPISAHHGLGVAEALDRLLEILPLSSGEEGLEGEASALPLAIVGRPNVGKSLLLNALLGWERAIVSEVPGTTRDAIDTPFTYDGRRLILIDTAGLRRRSRRREDVERHAALRSERAIRRADVALLVLDATEPATDQDTNIARAVVEAHKGLVLVVNKWDLIGLGMAEGQGGLGNKGDQQERAAWAQAVRHRLSFVSWAPLCFISALNRQGLKEMMDLTLVAWEARRQRFPTALVNQVVRQAVAGHSPPSIGSRSLKVLYVTQAEARPPTFVFFVNDPSLLKPAYQRYLERCLRQAFSFEGTALKLVFRAREAGGGPRP